MRRAKTRPIFVFVPVPDGTPDQVVGWWLHARGLIWQVVGSVPAQGPKTWRGFKTIAKRIADDATHQRYVADECEVSKSSPIHDETGMCTVETYFRSRYTVVKTATAQQETA